MNDDVERTVPRERLPPPDARKRETDPFRPVRARPGGVVAITIPATLLWALSAAAAAIGQAPTVIDRVDVRVVNVDVVVTDRKGEPVLGLGPEDFVLREDGEPVEITYFSPPGADGASSSAGEPIGAEATGKPGVDARYVVLYLDLLATELRLRPRLYEAMAAYAESLEGRGMALVLVSFESRLQVEAGPTFDASEIVGALERLAGEPRAASRMPSLERSAAFRAIADSQERCENQPRCIPCVDNWEEMLQAVRNYAAFVGGVNETSRIGLLQAVGLAAALEGRKLFVYAAESLERLPGMELFSYLGDLCPQRAPEVQFPMMGTDSTGALGRLAAIANSHRVTLLTHDVAGVRHRDDLDFASHELRPSQQTREIAARNAQSALFFLADETGGASVLNATQPGDGVGDLGQLLDASYSLGFVPSHAPSDRIHRIDVEVVGRKRQTVRHRRSYYDRTEEQRLAEDLLSVLWLGVEQNELGAAVEAGDPDPRGDGWRVPIEVTLAPETLVAIDGPEGRAPTVRVWLSARDLDRGSIVPMRQELIPLPAQGEPGAPAAVVVQMDLPAGRHRVAIAIRDELGQKVSYLPLEVALADPGSRP